MLSNDQVSEALTRAVTHEGKPYDFDFDFTRADRLVCTEVVYRCYEGIGGIGFELARRAGRMTLAAEDILRMARNRQGFEPVAAYCRDHAGRVVTAGEVDAILDATMGPSPEAV